MLYGLDGTLSLVQDPEKLFHLLRLLPGLEKAVQDYCLLG